MLQFMGVLIMASIEFKGLNELMNYFKKAPKLAQTEMTKIVKHCGSMCHIEEQRRVPVDTGFLKRSIFITIKDLGLTAKIEPTANYASYVEYGTRKMDAQPYVRPAYDKASKEFVERTNKLFKK